DGHVPGSALCSRSRSLVGGSSLWPQGCFCFYNGRCIAVYLVCRLMLETNINLIRNRRRPVIAVVPDCCVDAGLISRGTGARKARFGEVSPRERRTLPPDVRTESRGPMVGRSVLRRDYSGQPGSQRVLWLQPRA